MNNDINKNKDNEKNQEEHSISQILITLCLIAGLVTMCFSINTYFLLKQHIDVETGKVNIDRVIYMDEK